MSKTQTPAGGNKTAMIKGDKEKMRQFLTVMEDKIAAILPRHLTPQKMSQVVMVEASRNPDLYHCTPKSLAASIMLSSELGLVPSGPLGEFYLIPRNMKGVKECTSIIGYKGLCKLARNSGEIARINADVVYEGEIKAGVFSATKEPPDIRHDWCIEDIDRSDKAIVLAYAKVAMKDGSTAQLILTRKQIEDRKNRSPAARGGYSPWSTDYAAMCRKTVLRALLSGGLVPLSADAPLAKALEYDADAPERNRVRVVEHTSGKDALAGALGMGESRVEEVEEVEAEYDDDYGDDYPPPPEEVVTPKAKTKPGELFDN